MIKEAIDRILALALPPTIEHDGITYRQDGYKIVHPPGPPVVNLHSLTGLRDYLKDLKLRDLALARDFFVSVDSPTSVSVVGMCEGPTCERHVLVVAKTAHNEFAFGRYMGQEEFVIALQTQFVLDDNLSAVLSVAGNLSSASDVNVADDGVTQNVTVQLGVIRKETRPVTNPVTLKPYRTFLEVEQAPCQLVLRFQKGKDGGPPSCALFEADGGLWKITSMKNCAEWLKNEGITDVLC